MGFSRDEWRQKCYLEEILFRVDSKDELSYEVNKWEGYILGRGTGRCKGEKV